MTRALARATLLADRHAKAHRIARGKHRPSARHRALAYKWRHRALRLELRAGLC